MRRMTYEEWKQVDREEKTVNESPYEKGRQTLISLMGDTKGLEDLASIAPELSRYAIEAVGELYNNAAVDKRTRELATVAALTALGNARPQLKAHIIGAMGAGAKRTEIVAIITQMYAYAGFPAAINGMDVAREVFEEIDGVPQSPS
jgi:4-carboxymuconolactone decarboxylase